MTMVTETVEIPAGEFKAKCLALLDEVALTGKSLIVTKRGKPVARICSVEDDGPKSLEGSVVWQGDILSPVGDEWEADS